MHKKYVDWHPNNAMGYREVLPIEEVLPVCVQLGIKRKCILSTIYELRIYKRHEVSVSVAL
jgi:hypothetical protein